jgi:hypothetical protein
VPFKGHVVDISTSVGTVSATPNHPILTSRGWVAAGEINEGDDLIQAIDDAMIVGEPNEKRYLPSFDELFCATSGAAEVRSKFEFNFHGDIPDADVNAVSFDHLLSNDGVAEAFQSGRDFALALADGGIGNIGARRGRHVPESGLSSLGNNVPSLFVGQSTHADKVGGALVAQRAASRHHASTDCEPSDAVSFGERELAFTGSVRRRDLGVGQIAAIVRRAVNALDFDPAGPELLAEIVGVHADRSRSVFEHGARRYKRLSVINKRFRDFLDHVYTIESLSGWYGVTPAGIIVKNCRCYPEPVIPDDF